MHWLGSRVCLGWSYQVFKCNFPVTEDWLQASELEWLLKWDHRPVHWNPTCSKRMCLLEIIRSGKQCERKHRPEGTIHCLTAVVPKQDKAAEKAGQHPAARYHDTHSSRVRHTIFPAACLLFFLCHHLSEAHCMYLFHCLQTHSVCESSISHCSNNNNNIIIIIIIIAETCFSVTQIFIPGWTRD